MTKAMFYIGHFFQLIGFFNVGLCLFSGIRQGDYGKFELFQFILGSIFFYIGHFMKRKK